MKRGFTLIESVVVVAIVSILAAVLAPVLHSTHGRGYERRSSCQINLKNICLGAQMYQQDYDDTFPRAVVGLRVLGWADAIEHYLGIRDYLFQCPSERTPHPIPGAGKSLYTDYWMNERLSGALAGNIRHPARTLLFGEGNEGAATYHRNAISSLPAEWLGDEDSPLYRHITGANYAFADGHVKYLQAVKITSPTQIGSFTFAMK